MAKVYEEGIMEGIMVEVTRSPDDREWQGRICRLIRIDRHDDNLPYRVIDEDGEDIWVHDVKPYSEPQTTTQVSQTGEEKMTKINAIVSRAKTATFSAATLQAGKALNIAVIMAAKAKAPMMVRGYLDHPAAPAVLALALVSLSEFLPENPTKAKIVKAADLMLVSAMVDGADKFLNVEAMIDQVFNGLPAEVKTALGS